MKSAKSKGRRIGVLLVVQLAGLIVPFVLLHPLTTGSQDYLANAAAASFQIKLAVLSLVCELRAHYRHRHRGLANLSSVQRDYGTVARGRERDHVYAAGGR